MPRPTLARTRQGVRDLARSRQIERLPRAARNRRNAPKAIADIIRTHRFILTGNPAQRSHGGILRVQQVCEKGPVRHFARTAARCMECCLRQTQQCLVATNSLHQPTLSVLYFTLKCSPGQ